MARGLTLLLALSGCSLFNDFDDECTENRHCAPLGAGFTCVEGSCRAGAPDPDAAADAAPDATPDARPDPPDSGPDAAIPDLAVPDMTPDAAPPVPVMSAECTRLVGATEAEVQAGEVAVLVVSRATDVGTTASTLEVAAELARESLVESRALTRPLALLFCTEADLEAVAEHAVAIGAVGWVGGFDGAALTAVVPTLRASGLALISPAALAPALRGLEDDGLVWQLRAPLDLTANAAAQLVASQPVNLLLINKIEPTWSAGASTFVEQLCALEEAACDPGALAVARYSDAIPPAEALAAHTEFAADAVVTFAPPRDLPAVYGALADRAALVVTAEGVRSAVAFDLFEDTQALLCHVLGLSGGLTGAAFEAWHTRMSERTAEPVTALAARYSDAVMLFGLALATMERLGLPPDAIHVAPILARMSAGAEAPLAAEHLATAADILGGSLAATVDVVGVSGPLDFDADGVVIEVVEGWRYHLTDGQIESVGSVYSAAEGLRRPPDKSPDARCAELVEDP